MLTLATTAAADLPVPPALRLEELPSPAASLPDKLPVEQRTETSQLWVFISLDMPVASLRRLLPQAQHAKANVVLRGLKSSSLRQTVAAIQDLTAGQIPVHIDPRLFDRFAVTQVPTLVLTKPDTSLCSNANCPTHDFFVKAAGDVSLDYALEYIREHAPAFADAAESYLHRLEQR